ncbi:MAG: DEAD/DEAH box helicase family protein [Sphingomonas sp.]
MRLILGAFADSRDIEAVTRGEDAKALSERLGTEFLAVLDQAEGELFKERFAALAWLVAHGRLEIKVALRPHGMYHDKIGIITDADGDAFVFAGSANESAQALLPTHNYESIDVFPTWKPELEPYFSPHRESFERLWENRSRGTAVMDVPTALRERLLHVGQAMELPPDPEREAAIMRRLKAHEESEKAAQSRPSGPLLPDMIGGFPFAIRQHQRDALNAWREKGAFVGIFDLATGAGKTITACYAIVQMAKNIPGLTVVIAVPYQNLADQWCDILELFGIDPVRCYVSRADWEGTLHDTIHEIEMAARSFAAIVVVNRTLKSPEFQHAIARIPGDRFLWIGDECHHHASESYLGFLPESAGYRIGLSATPEHYLDADRNARLAAYYGETVFTYSLRQAIEDGVLTPYDYFPHIVALTHDEAEEFVELSNEIARSFTREAAASKPSQGLTALLMRRARMIASAANKIPKLSAVLEGRRPHPHTLFYCGDGTGRGRRRYRQRRGCANCRAPDRGGESTARQARLAHLAVHLPRTPSRTRGDSRQLSHWLDRRDGGDQVPRRRHRRAGLWHRLYPGEFQRSPSVYPTSRPHFAALAWQGECYDSRFRRHSPCWIPGHRRPCPQTNSIRVAARRRIQRARA